jgi:hypothetical protein
VNFAHAFDAASALHARGELYGPASILIVLMKHPLIAHLEGRAQADGASRSGRLQTARTIGHMVPYLALHHKCRVGKGRQSASI